MNRSRRTAGTTRRDFIRQIGVYLAVTGSACCGSNAALAQWPGSEDESDRSSGGGWPGGHDTSAGSFDGNPLESGTRNSGLALQGCTLSANQADLFDQHGIRVLRSSGHPGVDEATFAEQRYLSGHIGNYRPSLAFLEDSQSKNAVALSRDVTNRGSPHGAVLIGVTLIRGLLNRPGARTEYSNAWSVAAVMAHEWAHIAQFATGVRTRDGRVVGLELMADAVSGWYLAKKLQLIGQIFGPQKVQQIGASDQTAAARAVYSLGDTNFTSQNHHGTHEQRLGAFVAGHNMGMQGGTFDHVFQFAHSQFVRH